MDANKKYRESNHSNIGANIRKWRLIKNIEAKEFAKLLHISPGAVSRISEIAKLFAIEPEKLFVDPLDLLSPTPG